MYFAFSKYAIAIIFTRSLKLVFGTHPSFCLAFSGFPIRIFTSVDLKYLGSNAITILPEDLRYPFSSTPLPIQYISSPYTLNVSTTNSRIVCV